MRKFTSKLFFLFSWRGLLVSIGLIMILAAILLPINYITGKAISPEIKQQIQKSGDIQRLLELQNNFRKGLTFWRISAVLLGLWSLLLARLWNNLLKGAAQDIIMHGKEDFHECI